MSNLLTRFDGGLNGFPRVPRLFQDFERLFGEFDSMRQHETYDRFPKITSVSTNEGYEVTTELPGATQSDIKVDVHNGALTISGERSVRVPEGYRATRRERTPVKFSRSLRLPEDVDVTLIEASMKDGVLTLTLPKRPEVKPREIPVKVH